MKNKLLIILLSFLVFCIPTMASDDYIKDYVDKYYSGYDYLARVSTVDGENTFPVTLYVFAVKDFNFTTSRSFVYKRKVTFKSETDFNVTTGAGDYFIYPDTVAKFNEVLYFSNDNTRLSALTYFGDNFNSIFRSYYELVLPGGEVGDVPPLTIPPLVSSVEDLTAIILSDVRTLIPVASLVLCLMLSVALLPRLLKRLMG